MKSQLVLNIALIVLSVISLLLALYALYRVYKSGKDAGYIRKSIGNHLDYHLATTEHWKCVLGFIVRAIVTVCFVELLVVSNGERWGDSEVFTYHKYFLYALGTSTLALLVFPGNMARRMHRASFVAFMLAFTCVLVTGLWLFVQFPLL